MSAHEGSHVADILTTTPLAAQDMAKRFGFLTTTIASGRDLLFSVPLNHISPSWYLRIMFNLDVPGSGYGSEPYSSVPFYWQDIPEKVRTNLHP